MVVFSRKVLSLHLQYEINIKLGALAHLARALDWQSKGDEFESRMLHKLLQYIRFQQFSVFIECQVR